MTIFTIPGSKTQYRYPETAADITLGAYLHYLEHIAPEEPQELAALRSHHAQLLALQESIEPFLRSAGHDVNTIAADDIGPALVAYLESGHATKKAAQLLPPLLTEWEKVQNARLDTVDAMTDVWYANKLLPYMARVVSHFTGVPLGRILGNDGEGEPMSVKTLEFLNGKITRALQMRDDYEYKALYIVQGEVYELPEKLMTKSTVIEFAEAAQFQENLSRLKNGNVMSLIDVCAVLLRKPGEAYSDEVYQRNRETFKALTLEQAMEIAFFLMRQSVRYANDFLTSTAVAAAKALPGALAN